jgi:TatD DNase family protein
LAIPTGRSRAGIAKPEAASHKPPLIDSHAHLYFDRFDEDRDQVIARAREAGVEAVINIGIDVETSASCVELARQHEAFYAAVGLHPTSELTALEPAVSALAAMARADRDRVVAVGEIGLDYYWKDVPPEVQKPRLEAQLDLALELGLPVIFHCRDALPDLFTALERRDTLPPGVFHCFSGGADDARRALDLGFHVSFAGNVTYPKAEGLREAARVVPPERLLLETDAPFLAPQKRRGKRNEPAFLPFTAACLAELLGLPTDELAAITRRATEALFGLQQRS